jgi:tetratricopeptide (TPR) repeat protein
MAGNYSRARFNTSVAIQWSFPRSNLRFHQGVVMKRLAFICLACVFWLSGDSFQPGSSVAAREAWTHVTSKHFRLIGNASEDDIRKVGARLEQFRASVSPFFDKPKRKFIPPITVFVFKDDETFTPFKPLYQGKPAEVSGYFQSSDDALYITLVANWRLPNPYAVILHEYVHYLTSNLRAPLPAWLAEGLAEYYSTFDVDGGGRKIVVGRAIPSRVQLLREVHFMPLSALLAADHDSPLYNEAGKKNLFYAESWALVHYLMAGAGDHRRAQFRRFLTALAEGQPAESGFRRAFDDDLGALELELMQYIRRNSYPPQQTIFDRKIEFDHAMQTAALGEAETSARLGDLLWHVSRYDEAEAALGRALALDPQLISAHTSLGLLRVRQKRYADARAHLQRAVEANSTDYRAHYYHAYAWQQEQVDETGYISLFTPEAVAGMRASLARAQALAPEFADTYKTLAFINLVLRENLDEAESLIKRALELEPGREDFAYTLAQVYTRQQNFAAARQVAERIVGAGEKADIRRRAQFLLDIIAEREAALARAKAEEADRQRQQGSRPAAADDATRPPGKRFEGEQVRGLLTRVECADSAIMLTVISGVRAFKFRAELGKVIFVRHTMEIPNQITCGAIVPARQVIVTYRAANNAKLKIDGEPVGVEFLKLGSD